MEKGGGWKNLTNDTPPKKGFWTPLVRYVFHPPHVSVLCFSCTEIHDRADQKLFWRGPKIFGRARSLVRFPPPIRFAPPHITAQPERASKNPVWFPEKCLKARSLSIARKAKKTRLLAGISKMFGVPSPCGNSPLPKIRKTPKKAGNNQGRKNSININFLVRISRGHS